MIYGLAHVGLFTKKFEETIDFYKKAFNAVETLRFKTDKNGCVLQIGSFYLEILEGETPSNDGCFKHIALKCDNVDEIYEAALAQGAKTEIAPKVPAVSFIKRVAFVRGINNEQIEICEEA